MTTVLCLFCFKARSQVYTSEPTSTFSFTVGMTSTQCMNDTLTYKPGILCNGGFIYTIRLNEKLNFGTEILYTGKSFKGNDGALIKYRYFYLDVPLYLQYKLGDNIRFNLGGQYSTFTNSKVVVLDVTSKTGVDIRKYNNIKASDIGVLFGAEVDITDNLALAARYTLSTDAFGDSKVAFGVFQLSFNYSVYKSHKEFLNRKKDEKK